MGLYMQDCKHCHEPEVRLNWGCDQDTPHELDRYPCSCNGHPDCQKCDGTDTARLRRCPNKFVSRHTHSVIRYAVMARDGLWPVSGGSIDQSQSFLDAVSVVTTEINRVEAELAK